MAVAMISFGISQAMQAIAASRATKTSANLADDGVGFNSFKELKEYLGPAGEGKEWHHIVEKNQITKSGFTLEQIHNTNNVIALDKSVHTSVSSYYSSRYGEFSRFRDFLVGKNFDYQYQRGIDVLRMFGVSV